MEDQKGTETQSLSQTQQPPEQQVEAWKSITEDVVVSYYDAINGATARLFQPINLFDATNEEVLTSTTNTINSNKEQLMTQNEATSTTSYTRMTPPRSSSFSLDQLQISLSQDGGLGEETEIEFKTKNTLLPPSACATRSMNRQRTVMTKVVLKQQNFQHEQLQQQRPLLRTNTTRRSAMNDDHDQQHAHRTTAMSFSSIKPEITPLTLQHSSSFNHPRRHKNSKTNRSIQPTRSRSSSSILSRMMKSTKTSTASKSKSSRSLAQSSSSEQIQQRMTLKLLQGKDIPIEIGDGRQNVFVRISQQPDYTSTATPISRSRRNQQKQRQEQLERVEHGTLAIIEEAEDDDMSCYAVVPTKTGGGAIGSPRIEDGGGSIRSRGISSSFAGEERVIGVVEALAGCGVNSNTTLSSSRPSSSDRIIWGGDASTFIFYANGTSKLRFSLHYYRSLAANDDSTTTEDNANDNNPMIAETIVNVSDILCNNNDEKYPNTWLAFNTSINVESFTSSSSSSSSTTSQKTTKNNQERNQDLNPQIQVRLTTAPDRLIHPQQTCPRLTSGPRLGNHDESSYVIRKMALYSCAPVLLNVYDVSTNAKIKNLNRYIKATMGAGIFHAAIEVYGKEYSFGGTLTKDSKVTGVFSSNPKSCPMHHYRESVYLGDCHLSKMHVEQILGYLKPNWLASSYNVFKKNCCHFSKEFSIQLGVGDIPGWVYTLAESASIFEPYLEQLKTQLRNNPQNSKLRIAATAASAVVVSSKSSSSDNNNINKNANSTYTNLPYSATSVPSTAAQNSPNVSIKATSKNIAFNHNKLSPVSEDDIVQGHINVEVVPPSINVAGKKYKSKNGHKSVLVMSNDLEEKRHKDRTVQAEFEVLANSTIRTITQEHQEREDGGTLHANIELLVDHTKTMTGQTLLDHAMAARIQRSYRLRHHQSSILLQLTHSEQPRRLLRQVASEEC